MGLLLMYGILISIHPLRAAQSGCCCNTGKKAVLEMPNLHSFRTEEPEEKVFRGVPRRWLCMVDAGFEDILIRSTSRKIRCCVGLFKE